MVKSGKLEIVLKQFAPTTTRFYLFIIRAPETAVGAFPSVPFAP
jgi:hypothetical protein